MKPYFYGACALNKDIERHLKEEVRLNNMIAQLEGSTRELDQRVLRTYQNLRCHLLASKAQVVNKLGRK